MHTKEDGFEPFIEYSAEELIDKAAEANFDVIAITHHMAVYFPKHLSDYAKKKGILLIPGTEAMVEGNEVLVLGKTKVKSHMTFSELKELHDSGALVIAPHPYYPKKECLMWNLKKHKDLFDAIEYCHFYMGWFTNMFNRMAIRASKKLGKPMVGTSDVHNMYQFNNTYTLVDAEKNIESVFSAVRKGKVEVVTNPLSTTKLLKHIWSMLTVNVERGRKRFKNN